MAAASPEEAELTKREREILTLVSKDFAVKEIGCKLHIAQATVRTHLLHIFKKMGVHSQAAAVAKAIRQKAI